MIDEVIPKFPAEEQAELKKAADNFRYPFWDFAAKKPQNKEKTEWDYDAPLCIRDPQIEVKVPGGKETIHNPWYSFKMPGDYTMGDDRIKPNVVTREPVSPWHMLYSLTDLSSTAARKPPAVMPMSRV